MIKLVGFGNVSLIGSLDVDAAPNVDVFSASLYFFSITLRERDVLYFD